MPVLQRVSISVKNILVATDFSSVSNTAAAYAKALALNYRSHVELAYVFDPGGVNDYVDALLGLETKERLKMSTESLSTRNMPALPYFCSKKARMPSWASSLPRMVASACSVAHKA